MTLIKSYAIINNMIDLSEFKNLSPIKEKLIKYGFTEENGGFIYNININSDYYCLFTVKNNQVKIDVFESDTKEKLQLFYLQDVTGSFIGEINAFCENLSKDIAQNCFEVIFDYSEYANKITEYISKKYSDKFERLWQKFPEDGIWRRSDNQKWYALLMVIPKNKLGLDGESKISILNVKADKAEIPQLIDNKSIFPAYHMSKKSWITICLDGSVELEKIIELIDKSYILAKEK